MESWPLVTLILALSTGALTVVVIRRERAARRSTAALARLQTAEVQRDQARLDRGADRAVLGDALNAGVIRLDTSLRVTEANRPAHEIMGRTPGTLPGRSVMEAFLDPAVERLARAAQDVGSADGEVRLADADGPALIVRVRRTPGGDLWVVLDDVTELRRLQRIRAEFIDNLSHELRTPLTTVSLLAETLQREAEGAGDAIPARMRDRIAKIEIETGHLVQMVNEILDLSRIEGGGTLDLADGLDMGRLAAGSAERLRLFAERQGVALRIETRGDLPPVRGDSARLGQVVVNLVHNAVKFSPDGGEITVHARVDGDVVITSVADHGIGIPRAARDRVFERFYKVDRARLRAEVGGGTGLGLAIARHVIDQHGGRIWVDSEEGVGSTFSFALPIAGASRPTAQ